MENTRIFALGGQDENGKNCFVFTYAEDIYIINSGVKIPINSLNGVDTIIPNFDYLIKNKNNIKGIFITDVKNETFSALPWLIMNIPGLKIYCSEISKSIIQDRLVKYNISKNNYKIFVFKERKKIGDIYVQPLSLPGSVPGNIGIDFITKNGDYIFMFNYVEGNLDIFGRAWFLHLPKFFSNRKIIALVSDAGKSNYNGKAMDKFRLPKKVFDLFESTPKNSRIIVGGYSEDMISLHQILLLATKYKRPIIPYGKNYADMLDLIKEHNAKLGNKIFIPELFEYKNIPNIENAVILVTGAIERLYTRFLRVINGEDVYLKIQKNDRVLIIAPPVNGMESQYASILDEIAKITPELIEINDNEYFYCRPTKEDLLNLIKNLKPDFFLPTQGLYRYLTDAINYIKNNIEPEIKTQSLLLTNGKILHFVDGKKFSHNGKIKEISDVIVDGFGIGDISSEVINEREVLGREGVIIINALYDSKEKKIINDLIINYVGVIDQTEYESTNNFIKSIILDIMQENVFGSMNEFNEKVRKTVRKKIFKLLDKDPLVAFTLTPII
ncbi:ribonuclease J [Mycoplasma leonicaptivi]|uniref:ribonuclease J n=1 Tax=Mycoplasma leonicaptivi TaxID=36742 RepID=UPI000488441A|nr:ribonuclease J [Mycoplasma leonicaptivi]